MNKRIKKAVLLCALAALSVSAHAKTVYVTDKLSISLRTGDSSQHRILKMLMSGTALTVLRQKPESGYTLVRAPGGEEGWVLTRFLTETSNTRSQLEKALAELAAAKAEIQRMGAQTGASPGAANDVPLEKDALTQERDRLSRELTELRHTAANAIQLKKQRDQLQERVVMVERELHKVKREKQTLEDNTNQDWFLYGGMLAFSGILIGIIIPRIGWRRKPSQWDNL